MAVVVAAGAGIGIGRLLWAGSDSVASGTGLDNAAADAAGACQAGQRVPPFSALAEGDDDAPGHFDRAIAAGALAQSAARLDDRYEVLNTAFQDITTRPRNFQVEGTAAETAHDKVTTLCAEVDD